MSKFFPEPYEPFGGDNLHNLVTTTLLNFWDVQRDKALNQCFFG